MDAIITLVRERFSRSPAAAHRLRDAESGQGMVEYALILLLIAVVVIVILTIVGNQTSNVFSNIGSSLGT
jgi:pilus assembly protein Flp/PilA